MPAVPRTPITNNNPRITENPRINQRKPLKLPTAPQFMADKFANIKKKAMIIYESIITTKNQGLIEDARIEQQLMDDSFDTVLSAYDYGSIIAYINSIPENAAVIAIKNRMSDYSSAVNKIELSLGELNVNAIAYIIIDYFCSNDIDFNNNNYTAEDVISHIRSTCGSPTDDAAGVPEQPFKLYTANPMSPEEFDETRSTSGFLGLNAPVNVSGEGVFNPYNREVGSRFYKSMKSVSRMQQANHFIQVTKEKIMDLNLQFENLKKEQKVYGEAIEEKTRLSEIEQIIRDARDETKEMLKKLKTPIAADAAAAAAAAALLSFGGGRKRVRKYSKKAAKSSKKSSRKSKKSGKSKPKKQSSTKKTRK